MYEILNEMETWFVYPVLQYAAVHWAAQNGHEDVVKFLVEKRADINIKTQKGVRDNKRRKNARNRYNKYTMSTATTAVELQFKLVTSILHSL
jgi:ankyrin repeat protein